METELEKIARIMGKIGPRESGYIMPWGQFMGRDLSEIKTTYLQWALTKDPKDELRSAIEAEIDVKGRVR
jgi:uncharacterized protein (DUF3820 family)